MTWSSHQIDGLARAYPRNVAGRSNSVEAPNRPPSECPTYTASGPTGSRSRTHGCSSSATNARNAAAPPLATTSPAPSVITGLTVGVRSRVRGASVWRSSATGYPMPTTTSGGT